MRVLIADDEEPARSRLRRIVEESGATVVGEAGNGLHALELVERAQPDVLLLDIEMPELNGLEVAEALEGRGPTVIFVTAYDEFAVKAFELCAADYVVKPVHPPRLAAALSRVKQSPEPTWLRRLQRELAPRQASRRVAVKCGQRYVVFDPQRVSALVARDHYTAILTEGRELLADDPLDAVAERLDPESFIRVHRSAIVHLSYLKELEREGDRKYAAVLDDAARTRVPISRERLPLLKRRLGLTDGG